MIAERTVIDTPGLYDLPAAVYHGDPCPVPSLSRSIAHTLIDRSPLHAWAEHPRLGGLRKQATAEMDMGSYVHALILGNGGMFEVGEYENYTTKAARAWRDECIEAGKTPILERDSLRAEEAATALNGRLDDFGLGHVFTTGRNEITAIWKEGDVFCRGMLDNLGDPDEAGLVYINDLKTCQIGHPRPVQSAVIRYGYDLQADYYSRAIEVLHPELAGRVRYRMVFLEPYPPYVVSAYELNGEWRALARSKMCRALDLWQKCLSTDTWPAYADHTITLEPPAWAKAQEESASGEDLQW